MSQVKTRIVPLKSILHTAAFRKGFDSVKNGLPYDYDIYNSGYEDANRWSYERGRQFAYVYNGRLKYGKKVSDNAIHAYATMLVTNVLV